MKLFLSFFFLFTSLPLYRLRFLFSRFIGLCMDFLLSSLQIMRTTQIPYLTQVREREQALAFSEPVGLSYEFSFWAHGSHASMCCMNIVNKSFIISK